MVNSIEQTAGVIQKEFLDDEETNKWKEENDYVDDKAVGMYIIFIQVSIKAHIQSGATYISALCISLSLLKNLNWSRFTLPAFTIHELRL